MADESKRYSDLRGDCFNHGLDGLWNLMGMIDDCAFRATEVAEVYSNAHGMHAKSFQKNLGERLYEWGEVEKRYTNHYEDLVLNGNVIFKREGLFVPVSIVENADSESELEGIVGCCSVCDQEIPKLVYPGWED